MLKLIPNYQHFFFFKLTLYFAILNKYLHNFCTFTGKMNIEIPAVDLVWYIKPFYYYFKSDHIMKSLNET